VANPFGSILPAMKVQGGPEPAVTSSATRTASLGVKASGSGLPSYKKGTSFVRRTGPAKLEKGEAVLNVKQAKRYRRAKVSGASSALGAGKKKVPSKTRRLTKAAGDEMKKNPPAILKKTLQKSGPKRAEAQRVAILLSKARAAGADIPEKK
jgi:hypothetical protein